MPAQSRAASSGVARVPGPDSAGAGQSIGSNHLEPGAISTATRPRRQCYSNPTRVRSRRIAAAKSPPYASIQGCTSVGDTLSQAVSRPSAPPC